MDETVALAMISAGFAVMALTFGRAFLDKK